jgi:hypothetical protein
MTSPLSEKSDYSKIEGLKKIYLDDTTFKGMPIVFFEFNTSELAEEVEKILDKLTESLGIFPSEFRYPKGTEPKQVIGYTVKTIFKNKKSIKTGSELIDRIANAILKKDAKPGEHIKLINIKLMSDTAPKPGSS